MTEKTRSISREEVVEAIAREAGDIALGHFHSLARLPVEQKGHLDLVTAADRDVETFLIGRLREAFPLDGVYGEEGSNITGSSGRVWVLDPIDGTFNFVRGARTGPSRSASMNIVDRFSA
jgi:myo-inositol-1(or 4)-monophosphatase